MVSYLDFPLSFIEFLTVLILVVVDDGLVLSDYKFTKLSYLWS